MFQGREVAESVRKGKERVNKLLEISRYVTTYTVAIGRDGI